MFWSPFADWLVEQSLIYRQKNNKTSISRQQHITCFRKFFCILCNWSYALCMISLVYFGDTPEIACFLVCCAMACTGCAPASFAVIHIEMSRKFGHISYAYANSLAVTAGIWGNLLEYAIAHGYIGGAAAEGAEAVRSDLWSIMILPIVN